jgi:hypothetical protein
MYLCRSGFYYYYNREIVTDKGNEFYKKGIKENYVDIVSIFVPRNKDLR